MVKSKKFQPNFKIISIIILLISLVDSYTLLKNEHFSQLFWFCNAALYLLAVGLYFENSMVLTGVLVGALAVQIPWVLDFLIRLFFLSLRHFFICISRFLAELISGYFSRKTTSKLGLFWVNCAPSFLL